MALDRDQVLVWAHSDMDHRSSGDEEVANLVAVVVEVETPTVIEPEAPKSETS